MNSTPSCVGARSRPATRPRNSQAARSRDEEAAAAARADFLALQQVIPDFPAEARAVIERLCVDDLHVPQHFLPDLIVLLERIDAALMGGRRATAPLSRERLPLRRRARVPS